MGLNFIDNTNAFKQPSKKEPATPSQQAVLEKEKEQILEKIDDIIGAKEFKTLCHELAQVVPQLQKTNSLQAIKHNCYLFAINDGAGCTSYLSLFSDLLCTLGLREPKQGHKDPVEVKYLCRDEAKFAQDYDYFMRDVRSGRPVVCIDISAFMSRTSTNDFKSFLSLLENEELVESTTFVFRVPFVKKEIIDSLKYSINDVLNVRAVCFPPLGVNELNEFAKKELASFGLSIKEDAWDNFQERIAEERADGKFYDLKTINKIVRELVYNKQLENAKSGKNDTTITAKDTERLCVYKPNSGASVDELFDSLVAGDEFRKKINEIVAQVLVARKTKGVKPPCIHMRFVGNPGTGKTTLARIVGKVFREKGILRVGNFFECAGRDLVGRYIGETAPKTASMCRDAYGSILFIDEAYSLYKGASDEKDFGREAIDTLIAEMENHRDDLVVIMAGYTDEMNKLLEANTGLASRIPYTIEFPNFTREQLYKIFETMLKDAGFKYEKEVLNLAKSYFDKLSDATINSKKFSNGRFVRNLYERTFAKACTRTQIAGRDVIDITAEDFNSACADAEFLVEEKKPNRARIGF